MLTKKDMQIIGHLRSNARQRLTNISEKTGIPVTTIYDKIKKYEECIIKKHVSLIDFSSFGYHVKAYIALKIKKKEKESAKLFLMSHHSLNSLYKIDFGYDFLLECIFESFKEAESFINELETNFGIEKKQLFNVIEELKKEEFLMKK